MPDGRPAPVSWLIKQELQVIQEIEIIEEEKQQVNISQSLLDETQSTDDSTENLDSVQDANLPPRPEKRLK